MPNPHPAPTVDALLALLQQDNNGLGVSTAELAQRMGKSMTAVAAKLSRMRQYGQVERINPIGYPQELVRWIVAPRRGNQRPATR